MAADLTRRQLVGYATGSIAPGVFSTLPGLLLLYYLTNTLGVGAGLGGVLVLLPKLWDVVANPLVGLHSDRRGVRAPYVATGSVVIGVTLAVLFAVPHLPLWATCAWVVVAYTACNTGYAVFETPYVAVPAEISTDYDERTVLNGWRTVVLTVGVLLAGGLAPGLVSLGGGGRGGYALMGVVIGLVVAGSGLWSARRIAATPVVRRRSSAAPIREQLRALRANRPFAVLLGAYSGQTLALGAQLAAVPYFATYTLHEKGAVTVLFLALVGPALVVTPAWVARAGRCGKVRAMVEASSLYALGSVLLVFAPSWPHGVTYAVSLLLGVGFAGMQLIPYAMLPDTLDGGDDGQAGGLSGVWIGGETLGFALGAAILSIVLALSHFRSTVDAHAVAQGHAALAAVRYGFALLPPALLLATLPLLRRYAR